MLQLQYFTQRSLCTEVTSYVMIYVSVCDSITICSWLADLKLSERKLVSIHGIVWYGMVWNTRQHNILSIYDPSVSAFMYSLTTNVNSQLPNRNYFRTFCGQSKNGTGKTTRCTKYKTTISMDGSIYVIYHGPFYLPFPVVSNFEWKLEPLNVE